MVNSPQLPYILACIALVLIAIAEIFHVRRSRKLAHLAFGPNGKPRSWTLVAPILRTLSITMLVWGFTVLFQLVPEAKQEREIKESEYRRVVILLDVSPSMKIRDGGRRVYSQSDLEQTRAQRGAQIIESLLSRLYQDEIRFTVVAFYNGAKTIVKDTKDVALVTNIMEDLPVTYAFKGGKTDLFAGISHTFELAKDWRDDSATVIMVTDGDTIPQKGAPTMPKSISKFLVVGVGSTTKATYVHEHNSRQDSATLRQLAVRLGGEYQDVNSRHLSTDLIEDLTVSTILKDSSAFGMREYARLAILLGALQLIVLPILLEKFGCDWKSERSQPKKL